MYRCGNCFCILVKRQCKSSLLVRWSFRYKTSESEARKNVQKESQNTKCASGLSVSGKNEIGSTAFRYPNDLASIETVPFTLNCAAKHSERKDQGDFRLRYLCCICTVLYVAALLYCFASEADVKFRFPSVTKILDSTRTAQSREALASWRNNMIDKHGKESFDKLVSDRLKLGHALHEALTMQYLTLKTPADEVQLSKSAEPYWNSLKPLLPSIEELISREAWVNHSRLCYKGRIDALLKYKNRVVLLELKTSDRLKVNLDSMYDSPLQLVAYAGALNSMPDYPKARITNAIIIVCYKDSEATVFELDVRNGLVIAFDVGNTDRKVSTGSSLLLGYSFRCKSTGLDATKDVQKEPENIKCGSDLSVEGKMEWVALLFSIPTTSLPSKLFLPLGTARLSSQSVKIMVQSRSFSLSFCNFHRSLGKATFTSKSYFVREKQITMAKNGAKTTELANLARRQLF
ncbi:hypothetical protein M513_00272 [Trichuris suis]|uniref:PD-(D/E)XK endonuclease-like domain-containing protein n=1 Tax=Trichuris suis TaxID=68888 RepID=A0A085MPG3_9BILA|nr:hypothetical protein M513_00272 [Trichuris suis]